MCTDDDQGSVPEPSRDFQPALALLILGGGNTVLMSTSIVEDRYRAMGSDIHLLVVGGEPGLTAVARTRIEQLERRWSRFRADSEISRLNVAAGTPVEVSADTVLLVERAIEAWRLTGGGFDPTLLDALIAAGYDRSFDQLAGTPDRPRTVPRLTVTRPGVTEILVQGTAVTLPEGMGFDPGGIGKGLAADLVTAELVAAGADGVCLNMGGDVCVRGSSPTGAGWTLAIEHPWCDEPIALVGLWQGAVATSSVLRKVWTVDGQSRHHLIDPHTEQPSETDLALASVIAGDAWVAEVLAKAVLLRGSDRAFDLLDEDAAALTVDHEGNVGASVSLLAYLGGARLPGPLQFDRRPTPEESQQ